MELEKQLSQANKAINLFVFHVFQELSQTLPQKIKIKLKELSQTFERFFII
jgi:hypothetical protein